MTAAFAGGVPEILSLEITPMKWKVCKQGCLRTCNEQPKRFPLRTTSGVCSELPPVLFLMLKTALLLLS